MRMMNIRQSAVESNQSRSYLNQLCSEGLDIGMEGETPRAREDVCPVEITQGKDLAIVCDFPPINTLYLLPLRVVCLERTIVENCYIKATWDDQSIEFPYLVEDRGRYHLGSINLRVQDVLNDTFDNPFPMSRGAILEGMILAYGCEPIPEEVRRGIVPVEVTLVDTLGREARGEIRLEVERTAKAYSEWAHCPADRAHSELSKRNHESAKKIDDRLVTKNGTSDFPLGARFVIRPF
jgi:hypothetical protein